MLLSLQINCLAKCLWFNGVFFADEYTVKIEGTICLCEALWHRESLANKIFNEYTNREELINEIKKISSRVTTCKIN